MKRLLVIAIAACGHAAPKQATPHSETSNSDLEIPPPAPAGIQTLCYEETPVTPSHNIVRRSLDPSGGTITMAWFEAGEPSIPAETYKVDGARFTSIPRDADPTYTTTGTLVGYAWNWTGWSYVMVSKRGLSLHVDATMTDDGFLSKSVLQQPSGQRDAATVTTYKMIDCGPLATDPAATGAKVDI